LTPYVYTVRAINYDGDLSMVEYPKHATPKTPDPLEVEIERTLDEP